MGFNTGEVVAGASDIYGVQRLRASFEEGNAHAGVAPNEGRNAIHAMATATQDLLGIPRHGEGDTRINVGTIEGDEATNLIPEKGTIEIDIRGRDQPLLRYMRNETDRILEHSAESHGCTVTTESMGSAPSSSSDTSSRERVENAADAIDGITIYRSRSLGRGDDGAHLMEAVRDAGGSATYTIVGADLASSQHTDTFDIDEHALVLATDLLTDFVNLGYARDE